jgi:SPASM domain peptide maturase of grasp-with-spasm system
MQKTYYKLYENCHITIGASRSIIADNQRDRLYFIPNALAGLFDSENVLRFDNNVPEDIRDDYASFLLQNDLVFSCDERLLKNFPILDETWHSYSIISTLQVEVDPALKIQTFKMLEDIIENYGATHLEVNILGNQSIIELSEAIEELNKLDLFNYNISFSYPVDSNNDTIIKMIESNYKIFRCIVNKSIHNKIFESQRSGWGNIIFSTTEYSTQACGQVSHFYFCNSRDHINESKKFNTCLNRKLAITKNGDIKNCLSSPSIFGNYYKDNLADIISKTEFKRKWNIKKDDIDVCKICEFRNICTDCRIFLENPDDDFSKPLKCGYDPVSNQWSDWLKMPTKFAAIKHYRIDSSEI